MSGTYKNHGMIFYDSIYGGYSGVEACDSVVFLRVAVIVTIVKIK